MSFPFFFFVSEISSHVLPRANDPVSVLVNFFFFVPFLFPPKIHHDFRICIVPGSYSLKYRSQRVRDISVFKAILPRVSAAAHRHYRQYLRISRP